MNARTLQALTRERPSTILASTTRITQRQRIYHAAHPLLKRRRKRGTNPYWTDSWIAFVIDNHKSTSNGPKNTAHALMRLRPKITPFSLRRPSAPDVKTLKPLCSTAQVRTAPWTSEKMTKKPKEFKSDYIKSLARLRQDFIPVSKFDSDQVNHSLGTMKALSVSTQRRAGGGTTRTHQPALLPRDGNRLRGGNLLHGHRHQDGVNDCMFSLLLPESRCFAFRQWRFPCKRREV